MKFLDKDIPMLFQVLYKIADELKRMNNIKEKEINEALKIRRKQSSINLRKETKA